MSSIFFVLVSSEVMIADEGNAHESRSHATLETLLEDRKEGVDAHFTLEIDAFLVVVRLGKTKYDAIDSLFKVG